MVPPAKRGLTVGGVRGCVWRVPAVACRLVYGGVFSQRTSKAASPFYRLATRIYQGRKLGKHFYALCWKVTQVETPPSSFVTQILKLGGNVNKP